MGALGLEVGRRDRGKWPIMVQPPSETTTRQNKLSFRSIHGGILYIETLFFCFILFIILAGCVDGIHTWPGHSRGE